MDESLNISDRRKIEFSIFINGRMNFIPLKRTAFSRVKDFINESLVPLFPVRDKNQKPSEI